LLGSGARYGSLNQQIGSLDKLAPGLRDISDEVGDRQFHANLFCMHSPAHERSIRQIPIAARGI
jgi:hypothetical protein